MDAKKKTSTCKHCGKSVTHYEGRLWLADKMMIFPAYCVENKRATAEPIHEPVEVSGG